MKYSGVLKGMIKDLDELNLKPDQYSFALNAYVADKVGDEFFLQNGGSNLLGWVFEKNENVLGKIYISELDTLLLFTDTNKIIKLSVSYHDDTKANTPSIDGAIELPPLETQNQLPILSGEVIAQSACFNWNITSKIDVEYKITPTTLNIYFVDGRNENRYIYFKRDVDNNLEVHEEFKEVNSISPNGDVLYGGISCNKIRWNPHISYPEINTKVVEGGKLLAGVYQVLVSFATSKGIELTPYKAATNPIHFFTKTLTPTTDYDTGNALQIDISNLENTSRYQYVNIVVSSTIDGVTTYQLVTTLPVSKTISYLYTGENPIIRKTEEEIFPSFIFYKNARNLTKGNNILFLSNLREYEKINIQRIANLVKLKWFTVVAKEGEYRDPEFAQNYRTYPRDEVFPFGIKLILDNGEETHVGHIPGRLFDSFDQEIITSENKDVIQNIDECKEVENKKRWEVYNTAKQEKFHTDELKNCEYPVHSEGEFSYWQSTDKYPNDRNLFGELANTYIRHHKFPDCLVSPIHDGNNNMFVSFTGTNKIYPIGIKLADDCSINTILKDAEAYGWITKEQRERVVGYKIVRGNRANHKSIVAKGLLYDTFKYARNRKGRKYIYPNYPFNDLRNDPFLSGDDPEIVKERARVDPLHQLDYTPNYFESEGKYTFHSPDTHFNQPTIPSILKIENEVHGEANGFFNNSEDQAEYALLDQRWYNLAIIIGAHIANGLKGGEGGNNADTGAAVGGLAGGVVGSIIPGVGTAIGAGVGTLAGRIIGGFIGGSPDMYEELTQSMASLSQAEKVLQLFQNIVRTKNYHYQYQAIGKYSNIEKVENEGNKQRRINFSEYIEANGRQTVDNEYFDNFGRESSIYLKVLEAFPQTVNKDESRFLISQTEYGCDYENGRNITSRVSSYYSSLKRNLLNQYGSIFDIEYLPVSNKVWKLNEQAFEFGGDTFIGRFALKRKHHFFTNTAYNLPNYTDIFYDEIYNQGVPFYYFNTKYQEKEDIFVDLGPNVSAEYQDFFISIMSSFLIGNQGVDPFNPTGWYSTVPLSKDELLPETTWLPDTYSGLTADGNYYQIVEGIIRKNDGGRPGSSRAFLREMGRFFKRVMMNPFRLFKQPEMNFDCYDKHLPKFAINSNGLVSKLKWQIQSIDGKIYTYSYGIPYFLCESDVNLDLRYAINNNEHDFYPHQKDLSYWLQQKNVNPMLDNTFYYNRSYSKQNKEEINIKYDVNFFKNKDITHHRNRVVYSQQGAEVEDVNLKDNYLYFKPLDSFDFTYENGLLTSIDSIEGEKILVRFENNTRLFSSFDTLRTGNGIDVSLGTGSLFGGRPQEFSKTDLGFFGSQHTNILSSEFGHIIVDAKRGQIFKLGTSGNGLEILSNKGMKNWFKEHLPFHISKHIKGVDIDNEYNNIGISISFNKRYDSFHLTKLDYIPKISGIIYKEGKFYLDDVEISLKDERYFCNASWTISYSFPKESWVSFHTFTPNYYIDLVDTFYTGLNGLGEKTSSLWGHNLTNKSYQVYYGQLHPFIVEGFSTPTLHHKLLTHVSFLLTAERYYNKYDSFVREYISFNKAIVYNETQNSGLLELEMADPLNPYKWYPIINQHSRSIKIDNKEDIYSFNQFEDLSHSNLPRFKLSCSGVIQLLNEAAIDYEQIKINNSFIQNNVNFIRLINDKYSNYKMIFKGFLLNEKDSIR